MNVVYMGTPDFAVPSLEAIIKAGHNVTGVFTQPDKRVGRKQIVTLPPVKQCAQKNNIEVYQPHTLKDGEALKLLHSLNPDVIVVVAYGKILPKEILSLPRYGCINVHGSLLPKYRGAGPIQWAVLNGETKAGVTTMYMAEGLDTGDMLLKESVLIGENETAGELYHRLSVLGAELIVKTLAKAEKGELNPQKQDDSQSTYAPMLDKTLSPIVWTNTAQHIHNQVRGLNPWPVATAVMGGKKVKVFETRLSKEKGTPGTVLAENPLTIACGENAVEIVELQPEGKKRMQAQDFVRGYRIKADTKVE